MTKSLINRIRNLTRDKKISFIIGAGFSKNMSRYFISWEELLKPITSEMYNIKAEDDYSLKQKINEIGYLGIASEYVRRKGYHEAIDVYIEEHTPVIREVKGADPSEATYEVFLNGKKIDDADTTCHRLLMNLGIRHIYTFNYDNCLDILGNTHHSEKNLKEIWNLERNFEVLKSIYKEYKLFIGEIPQNVISNENTDIAFGNAENFSEKHSQIISEYKAKSRLMDTLSSELHKFNDNLNKMDRFINSLQVQIYSLQRERNRHYQLIASSHMLSLTDDKRNIYKLHGTLREPNTRDYGFDGDCHCQYIITSEDYTEYPQKHEPFVNYMKIALLKGAFCIVGFSCDDPNFISWISWVKDVVDKNPEIKRELRQKESARFFYIHSGTTPLTPDKKLLLRNHYIEFVDLSSVYPTQKEHKEQIMEFLTEITPSTNLFPRIKRAWNNINKALSYDSKEKKELCEMADDINYIYSVQNINRIPTQYSLDHFNREHTLIKLFKYKTIDSELEMKIVYSALNEEKLLLSHYFKWKEITDLLNRDCGDLQNKLIQLHCKELVLENKQAELLSFANIDKYLIVWNKLLNLDFKGAKKEIEVWNASIKEPLEKLKKIQIEAIFYDVNNKKLLELIHPDNYNSAHDYLNALALIPRINRCMVFDNNGGMRNSLDFYEEVMRLKNECNYLYSFEEIIDKLVESIVKKVKSPNSANRIYTFGKDETTYKEALKVLSILFDLCVPLYIRGMILFAKHKWELVFNILYEDYPYPCLFYSLQYNDRELTREISEKILYSNKLYEKLPSIVKSMFAALQQEECPPQFKESIMNSLPILLRGVDASLWSEDFKLFYNNLHNNQSIKRRYNDLNYSHESFYKLVSVGLSLITDKRFRLDVILGMLRKREEIGHYENFIIIEAKAKLTKDDFRNYDGFDEISENYMWLCENATKPVHTYVLLNLIDFFDKESVLNFLERIPLEIVKADCVLMKALPCYLQEKSVLKSRLKEFVIVSKYLWNNGIKDEGASFGGAFLEIAHIMEHLNFDNKEFCRIFDKMAQSFYQIKEYCDKERGNGAIFFLHGFTHLLYEMYRFIIKAKISGFKHEKMNTLLENVSSLIIRISSKGSRNITEMIMKDDITEAIKLLLEVPEEKLFEKHKTDYILIANRIILKVSESLDNCIRHYSWIIDKYRSIIDSNTFRPLSEAILDAYKPYYCNGAKWDIDYANKHIFEESLIVLYSAIKEWGAYDEFWDSYKPRYYK